MFYEPEVTRPYAVQTSTVSVVPFAAICPFRCAEILNSGGPDAQAKQHVQGGHYPYVCSGNPSLEKLFLRTDTNIKRFLFLI